MLKQTNGRLLPLRLPPIDLYFYHMDRPSHPTTFVSHMFLSGQLDRDAFRAAVEDAICTHPLLGSIVGRARKNELCWVKPENPSPRIEWVAEDQPIRFTDGERIDINREPGLRLWVKQMEDRCEIAGQFHHACTDGTGAHRFWGSLLGGYGIRTTTSGDRPTLAHYDAQLLKIRRSKLAEECMTLAHNFSLANLFRMVQRSLGVWWTKYNQKAVPLALSGRQPIGEDAADSFPGVLTHVFTKQQHQQLRQAASSHNAMMNDLLTAELFAVMSQWNRRHGKPRGRDRLRILMPTDLRDQNDFSMPAANMTSTTFLTRRADECDQPGLIASVREQMMKIKRDQEGKMMMDTFTATDHLHVGLLPFLLRKSSCLATITFTNIGDPTRRLLGTFPRERGQLVCGNLTLERMVGVSPLRDLTRAAVTAVTFNRELLVNVRFDPKLMSMVDTREFLDLYVERLEQHLS